MSLRTRTTLVIMAVFALYLAASAIVQWCVVYPRFLTLERHEARQDLERCVAAIDRDLEHLAVVAADWGSWDDTYQFIVDRNDSYASANLGATSMLTNHTNMLLYLDTRGVVVERRMLDLETLEPIEFSRFMADKFDAVDAVLNHNEVPEPITGIVITEHGPMLIASHPILTSRRTGPARGTVVFGRLLNDATVKLLVKQTRTDFTIRPLGGGTALTPPEADALEQVERPGEAHFDDSDSGHLGVYTTIAGMNGRPALLVRASVERSILRQGRMAMLVELGSMLVAALIVSGVLYLLLSAMVVNPVTQLTRSISRIGARSDLTTRLKLKRTDEIGALSRGFDTMLDRLAESHDRYMALSRDSGKAEVARAMLHNVGNVLNSVNISTEMMGKSIRDSPGAGLQRTAELLREHAHDLPAFFAQDQRAGKLPEYLAKLAEVAARRDRELEREVSELSANLGHVADIIRSQQEHAVADAIHVSLSTGALLDRALRAVRHSLDHHGIAHGVDPGSDPLVTADPSKALHILVNLVTNAKEALVGHARTQPATYRPRVDLTVSRHADGTVVIGVQDNGPGFTAEVGARIFEQGYSTKNTGRGLGLHYSATAAMEMQGRLTAHSDGPGKGAMFTLALPLAVETAVAT